MNFRLGELFCGPGGLAYAAINSTSKDGKYGIVHAWANDYDEETCETYRTNICPDAPDTVICHDVRTLDIDKLSPIDAFAFGFPCNDFSVVGEQKGFDGTFGPLYTYGVKVLKKFQPQWFLAENVGGLIHMANIAYNDKYRGKSQLNWDYTDYKDLSNKKFPTRNAIIFSTPKSEVKINMTLNYIGNESDWETRTPVSAKYKEVTVDDILRRFMAL